MRSIPVAAQTWTGRALVLAAAVFLFVYPMASDDLYYQNMIILSLVFAIAASGLGIITGLTGYVSLGQGAFIGLGGYTVGVLATRHPDTSVWLWMPLAGVVAGLVALVLGFVSLRARGPSFVIITVAFLFLVQVIAINWRSLTGGTEGLSLPLPTWDIDIPPPPACWRRSSPPTPSPLPKHTRWARCWGSSPCSCF